MSPTVRLTLAEFEDAEFHGLGRFVKRIDAPQTYGRTWPELFSSSCWGVIGEAVLGKFLGVPYDRRIGPHGGPDLVHEGVQYEAKYTPYATGHLWVPTTVPNHRACVLITGGKGGEFTLPGWLWAWEVKRYPTRTTYGRPPFHDIDQSCLHPMSTSRIRDEATV